MILFYSEFCKHCKVLLETIERHDKNKMIKLVSIDLLRTLKKPIDPKIHSVPALLILNSKEYLFGKAVFDHLLLPNRGVLFSGQITRDNKTLGSGEKTLESLKTDKEPSEPTAFTLGAISAEQFSSIDDENCIISDKNYSWDVITNDLPIMGHTGAANGDRDVKESEGGKSALPTMEEIMKKRASDII